MSLVFTWILVQEMIEPTGKLATLKGPCRAYNAVRTALLHCPMDRIEYATQQEVPNGLKMIEESRRMVLRHFLKEGQYPLREVIGQTAGRKVYIHIGRGVGEIVWYGPGQEKGTQEFRKERTYIIPEGMTIDY